MTNVLRGKWGKIQNNLEYYGIADAINYNILQYISALCSRTYSVEVKNECNFAFTPRELK